jgi:uncharacterized protein YjbJ (UPF0337 family)
VLRNWNANERSIDAIAQLDDRRPGRARCRLGHRLTTGAGPFRQQKEENVMDKDRIAGSAKEVIGGIKEATGKAVGDAKLKADGKAEKVEGKIQNAVGGIKDALKNL